MQQTNKKQANYNNNNEKQQQNIKHKEPKKQHIFLFHLTATMATKRQQRQKT